MAGFPMPAADNLLLATFSIMDSPTDESRERPARRGNRFNWSLSCFIFVLWKFAVSGKQAP
jgi:hypothetical protein